MEPRVLEDDRSRQMARQARDAQWAFMQRVADTGTVWLCWWNKNGHHKEPYAADLEVLCLISGMELLEWMDRHKDWWVIGKWDDARYAAPVQLTAVGREALANRDQYDLEPVTGGMVEPGWTCVPAEASAAVSA